MYRVHSKYYQFSWWCLLIIWWWHAIYDDKKDDVRNQNTSQPCRTHLSNRYSSSRTPQLNCTFYGVEWILSTGVSDSKWVFDIFQMPYPSKQPTYPLSWCGHSLRLWLPGPCPGRWVLPGNLWCDLRPVACGLYAVSIVCTHATVLPGTVSHIQPMALPWPGPMFASSSKQVPGTNG